MGNSSSYPPLCRPLTAETETEPDDQDDSPGPLAQAVDEALDACAMAWKAGNMTVAYALLTAAMATVDTLLMALGVDDPDEA